MNKILVHICCAVDSHYFLQKLQADYPTSQLIGFFYDPNIHPYSEYQLRLLETKRSCEILGIELIEGDYDVQSWLESVRGLEYEPEKGRRCSVCFDKRFDISAQMASKIGADGFTSTLLTSPKKSLASLKKSGDAIARRNNITFLSPDYRKASGTQEQNIMAKDAKLYRQDYCGCIYGLTIQRREQEKLTDELFLPVSRQIQPESIESRLELYTQRLKLEDSNQNYKIIKERFLNYRLQYALVKAKQQTVVSHIFPHSIIKRKYTRGKIEETISNVSYFSRNEVKFITLEYYNNIAKTNYQNITQLICNPPSYQEELNIRFQITRSHLDISPVIVTQEIPKSKLEIWIESEIFEDTKERLIQTI